MAKAKKAEAYIKSAMRKMFKEAEYTTVLT